MNRAKYTDIPYKRPQGNYSEATITEAESWARREIAGLPQPQSDDETIVREFVQYILPALSMDGTRIGMIHKDLTLQTYDISAHGKKYRTLLEAMDEGKEIVYTEMK